MSTTILGLPELVIYRVKKVTDMPEPKRGKLSRLVRRTMKEKGLTFRDVELRSGGEITDGYVANILRGDTDNPSAFKMKALARGLGIDAHVLFDAVCGPFGKLEGVSLVSHTLDATSLLEIIQEITESPELAVIVQEVIELSPGQRGVILESLKSLNRKRKPQRGKKPRRKE
jgi:transcriptional regulator with XRE-family HTH domain